MNKPENLSSDSSALDIRKLVDVLKRRWLVIVLSTILIAGAAFVVSSLQPVNYQAKATLLIQPAQNSTTNDYNGMLVASKLALTYSELLKGESVSREVISKLGLSETPEELAGKIVIETVPDTQLIQLTVSDTSSKRAAEIANTLADVFLVHTKDLQAERYSSPLKAIQEKIDQQSKNTEGTKAVIDSLNKQKVDYDIEINRLDNQLSDYQDNLRILQQNYQDIQLIIAQSSGIVQITEKAKLNTTGAPPPTASVVLQINQIPSTTANDSTMVLSERLASTYSYMVKSQSLLEEAIKLSGVDIKISDLASRVKVEQIAGTQMIMISVWDTKTERAMKITDAIAQTLAVQTQALEAEPYLDQQIALQKQIDDLTVEIGQTRASVAEIMRQKVQVEQDLERQNNILAELRENNRALLQDQDQLLLAEASSVDAVLISEPAREPAQPVDRRIINTILGMMVGGMLGIGLVFLFEYIEDKVRTRQDVYKTLGVHPITTISKIGNGKGTKVLDEWSSGTRIAEEFRTLGTKIRLASSNASLRTICVTSPAQSEGKTFILANLAVALASTGMKVIALDADLRFPRLHTAFGIEQGKGLSDFLFDNSNGVKFTEVKGVKVLRSGESREDPVGLLSSPHFKKLLEELSQKADLVLIDCPPVLPVADASILASDVDGILLILRADQTNNRAARDAVDNLAKANGHFVGVVLNAVTGTKDRYSRYYKHPAEKNTSLAPNFKKAQNLIQTLQKKIF